MRYDPQTVSSCTSTTPFFREQVTARDDMGRITAKSEVVGSASHSYVYGYDDAGRLTDVARDSSAIGHYEYDSNGNRIPVAYGHTQSTFNQTAGELTGATYDDQDRLLSSEHLGSSTSTEYTYTANGELTSKSVTIGSATDVTTYAYDFLGNLREVTLHATGTPTVIEYVIDGKNRRVGKRVGTLQQAFLYDGQLRIVAELNSSGTLISRFVYASKSNIPDYAVQGSATYRIISDHLGSLRLVVDASSGDVMQEMEYDDFGNVLVDNTASGFAPLPFGFAGGLYDRQTGLVRFGARDYDAETGRWTAKDPIGFDALDLNLYRYVFADPINGLDQSGMEAEAGVIGQLATFSVNLSLVGLVAVSGTVAATLRGDFSDFCHRRWEIEDNSCWDWANLGSRWVRACQDRAATRRDMCIRHGGRPHPGEPPEWSPFRDYPR